MINKCKKVLSVFILFPLLTFSWIPDDSPPRTQNDPCPEPQTLLEAMDLGRVDIVEKLLQQGHNPNQTYSYKQYDYNSESHDFNGFGNPHAGYTTISSTPLIKAATASLFYEKAPVMVAILLRFGANHRVTNSDGETALQKVEAQRRVEKRIGYKNSKRAQIQKEVANILRQQS